jgi:hypothetical protein
MGVASAFFAAMVIGGPLFFIVGVSVAIWRCRLAAARKARGGSRPITKEVVVQRHAPPVVSQPAKPVAKSAAPTIPERQKAVQSNEDDADSYYESDEGRNQNRPAAHGHLAFESSRDPGKHQQSNAPEHDDDNHSNGDRRSYRSSDSEDGRRGDENRHPPQQTSQQGDGRWEGRSDEGGYSQEEEEEDPRLEQRAAPRRGEERLENGRYEEEEEYDEAGSEGYGGGGGDPDAERIPSPAPEAPAPAALPQQER